MHTLPKAASFTAGGADITPWQPSTCSGVS